MFFRKLRTRLLKSRAREHRESLVMLTARIRANNDAILCEADAQTEYAARVLANVDGLIAEHSDNVDLLHKLSIINA